MHGKPDNDADMSKYTNRTPSPIPAIGKPVAAVVAVSVTKKPSTEKGGDSAVSEALLPVLVDLLALYHFYYAAHWASRGENFYSDHELFSRLYGSVSGEFDGLAERIIGHCGPGAVPPMVFCQAGQKVAEMAAQGANAASALPAEEAFQECVSGAYKTLEGSGKLTLGLDNFIQGIADNHETNLYLLRQRAG